MMATRQPACRRDSTKEAQKASGRVSKETKRITKIACQSMRAIRIRTISRLTRIRIGTVSLKVTASA